jgi:hypothetical protein
MLQSLTEYDNRKRYSVECENLFDALMQRARRFRHLTV